MKTQSAESYAYISAVLITALAFMIWLLAKPFHSGVSQNLYLICLGAVLFFELSAPPLPVFGSITAAGSVYIFLALAAGVEASAFTALGVVTIRSLLRDRGPWLLRLFFPFERFLVVAISGLLPLWLPPEIFANSLVLKIVVVGIAYVLIDGFMEGTAVGITLAAEDQQPWFKERYRALPLSFMAPWFGGLAVLFYKNNPIGAGILFFATLLCQLAMSMINEKDPLGNTAMILHEQLERAQRELRLVGKRYDEMRQQAAQRDFELGVLLDFGRAMGSNLTLDHAFEVILDILKKLFRYQSCIIFFAENIGQETYLKPKRFHTPYAELCKDLHVRLGESIVGISAEEAKSYLVDSVKSRTVPLLLENEASEMAVPLVVEDHVRGVLYVGGAEPGTFVQTDLQLLTTIAYQVAVVFLHAESYEYSLQMAVTDGLTGLFTHRYFQERLTEEVLRCERHHQPVSLIMIDVDNFKKYNDSNGHPSGDALLKVISQILKECTRESDVVCRYGGDEFSILLTETTKETAFSIAKRIRETVEYRVNLNSTIKITASLGVAGYPIDASNKADLLAAADKALYQSKKNGRNQVVAATPR